MDQAVNHTLFVHEFGHALLQPASFHINGLSTLMPKYPTLVDSATSKTNITGDLVELVQDRCSGTSTGINLTLWPFYQWDTSEWEVKETWTQDSSETDDPGGNWNTDVDERWYNQQGYAYGDLVDPDTCRPPGSFTATATFAGSPPVFSATVDIRISLTTNPSVCPGGANVVRNQEVVVTTNSSGLVINTSPLNLGLFQVPDDVAVPPGDYYLCAFIDPDDEVSETDESDNIIVSDKMYEVLALDVYDPPVCS